MTPRSREAIPDLQKKANQLIDLLRKLRVREYEPFVFEGKAFQLIWISKSESAESDAWFSESTMIDGYDVYVLKSLSGQRKLRRIFHEVLEATLSGANAHELALKEEERIFGSRDSST